MIKSKKTKGLDSALQYAKDHPTETKGKDILEVAEKVDAKPIETPKEQTIEAAKASLNEASEKSRATMAKTRAQLDSYKSNTIQTVSVPSPTGFKVPLDGCIYGQIGRPFSLELKGGGVVVRGERTMSYYTFALLKERGTDTIQGINPEMLSILQRIERGLYGLTF